MDLSVPMESPTLLHRNFGEPLSEERFHLLCQAIGTYLLHRPKDDVYRFFSKATTGEAGTCAWKLQCCKLGVDQDNGKAHLIIFSYDIEQLDNSKYGLLFFLESERFFVENYHKVNELTKREKEILVLIARGLYTKAVAAELYLSQHTVNTHLKNIYEKLSVRSRAGLMKYAYIFDIK